MKQKIVFFTARDLSNVGGGERMLSLIANGLCDSFSITILTPYEAESFYPFDERITIENLGFKNRKLSVLRKLQYFPILRKLQCFLHQTDICRFIACSSMAIILTSIIGNKDDERLMAWIHTSFYHPTPFYLRKIMLSNLYKFKIVCINSMDMEQYRKYATDVIKIPNPLPFTTEIKSRCNMKRLIAVGRLEKWKRIDFMIKSCARVLSEYDDWVLDIYGQDDGEKKRLNALIKENNMQGRIRLHAPVENIQSEYIKSSIFVTTSRIEAFSLVLLEACESGIPCIAYDVPSGPRDIVQNGYNGYLIQELNNESFELQLSKLMESETLRKKMGKNAILKAQEFEFAKILDLWKRQL